MIELPIEVTPDDGETYKVTVTSRDIRQLEKVNKNFAFTNAAALRMTDIYWLAWNAACRKGQYDGSLANFESTCDLDVLADEEEEVDPTRPAP